MGVTGFRWGAVVLALLVARTAAGQDQQSVHTVSEALSVPEGAACLTRDELAAHVASWLGRASIDGSLSIQVEFPHEDEQTGVTFVVVRSGESVARRAFPSLPEACDDRRSALALAVAIAIDATVLDRLARDEVASAPELAHPIGSGESMPEPTPRAAPTPREVTAGHAEGPRAAARWGLAVGADVGVTVGVLPVPAALGGAFVEVRWHEAWLVRVGAGATPVVGVPLGRGSAESQLLLGRLDACLLTPLHAFEGEACLGASGGRISAEGRGYLAPSSTGLAWAAAAVRFAARVPRDGIVSVRVALDGVAAVLRPTLEVHRPSGDVLDQERMPGAGLGASAGLVVVLR